MEHWTFLADSNKRKQATNIATNIEVDSGPGNTKKRKNRKKELTKNEDLKDKETDDCTEEVS